MKKHLTAAGILVSFLALDILTKHIVLEKIPRLPGGSMDFLGGFVRFTLVFNEGGVFGILQGYKTLFLIVSLVVLALMFVYYFIEKNRTWLFTVALAMIASGALGNIIDRLLPDRKGVVDFISVGVDGVYRWPAFNVADSAIVVGAFMFFIVFYLEEKRRRAENPQK